MKKLLTFLTLLTLSIGVSWAAETVYYTLDGTITGGTSGYDTESEITQGNMSWKVTGNTTMSPWRIGGKNLTSTTRPIYSETPMGSAISKITVELGTSSVTSIGGIRVLVYSDANMTTEIDNVLINTGISANSTLEFTPSSTVGTEWPTNAYYKINFTVSVSGTSNKFVQLQNIKFYKNEGGSQTPTHGITYSTVTGGSFSGPSTAAEGSTVTITPNPDAGYAFSAWNVTDASGAVTVTDNQFTMGTSDVTVSGSFTLLPTYGITVTNGSANPTSAYEGQTVTLTPTLPDGQVVDWDNTTVSPDGLAIDHTNYTFTMPDEAVTVAFAFKDAPLEATYIFNTEAGINALGITVPTSGNGTNLEEGLDYTSGIVTMTTTHGSTETRIWNAASTGLDLRIYGSNDNHPDAGTLSFAIANGYNITQIAITYGDRVGGFTASTGEFNDGYTTWTGEAQSVTLTANNQSRIKTITVTYAASTTPEPETVAYYLVGDNNSWSNTPDDNFKFTKQNDGTYILDKNLPDVENTENFYFRILKVENGNKSQYGGEGNTDYQLHSGWHTDITLISGGQAFYLPDCYQAIFTLDAENMKFSVDKPQLVMRESTDGSTWTDNQMTATDGGWTLTKEFGDSKLFHFYSGWHEHRGSSEVEGEGDSYHIFPTNQNRGLVQNGKNFYMRVAGEYTLTVNSDLNSLNIVAPKFRATIASGITGGSVSFNAENAQTTFNTYYNETVNVFVTPSTDYELASLTYTVEGENPVDFKDSYNNEYYSFTMPAANVTINATFNYTGTLTETTYQLITSNDKLEIGSKYIIVNNSGYALGIVGSDKNKGVAININNNTTVITSNSGVSEFTLGTVVFDDGNGNEVEAYSFKNGNNYLTNASGTGVTQSEDGNKDWSINIDNGIATIQNGGTQRYLRFYVDSKFFRAYTSTTQSGTSDIQIYKEVVEEPATEITLAGLVELGAAADGKKYCISDENGLLGVYRSGNTVWFKDEVKKTIELQNETLVVTGGAVDFDKPGDEQNYWINNVRTKDFDQSNWIEVVFPADATGIAYENVYVKNLTGVYSYNGGNRKLTITNVDALEENGEFTYTPNTYIPANFAGTQNGYFFSKPKVQEYAYFVKAQWNGSQMVMATDATNNPEGFTGSFSIMPVDGLDATHHVNDFYQFHGIVRKGTVGSPRLQAEGGIVVEATDLNPDNVVTAISTVAVSGDVKSVKYVNVAGMVSDRPFQGVNIVVTEYTDGSRTTAKVVK